MTLGEFRTIIRVLVPSANKGAVSNTTMDLLINSGVRLVNTMAKAYRGEEYFNVEDEVNSYNLRDINSNFTLIGKGGLWMNKGTAASPQWKKLDAVDRAYLDRKFPNWMNQDSSVPLYYIVEAGKIIVHPSPNADLTDGFWMPDFVIKPTKMTANTHYPFTGTTEEISDLEPLDDVIVDYVRWHLKHSVGREQSGLVTRKEFEIELLRKIKTVNRRPDISSNWRALRMKGRRG